MAICWAPYYSPLRGESSKKPILTPRQSLGKAPRRGRLPAGAKPPASAPPFSPGRAGRRGARAHDPGQGLLEHQAFLQTAKDQSLVAFQQ